MFLRKSYVCFSQVLKWQTVWTFYFCCHQTLYWESEPTWLGVNKSEKTWVRSTNIFPSSSCMQFLTSNSIQQTHIETLLSQIYSAQWCGSITTNKASGGDGIPIELFQILTDDANLENSAVAIGLEKVSFHSNPKERQCQRMLKLLHNCNHLTC